MVKPEARKTSSTSAFPVSLVSGLPALLSTRPTVLSVFCCQSAHRSPRSPCCPLHPLPDLSQPGFWSQHASSVLGKSSHVSGLCLTSLYGSVLSSVRSSLSSPTVLLLHLLFFCVWDRLFSCVWETLSLSTRHLSWAALLLQALLLYRTCQISLLNKLEPGDSFCYLSSSLLLGCCTLTMSPFKNMIFDALRSLTFVVPPCCSHSSS